MSNDKYISVSALNKYLYYKFDTDLNLKVVYLKAEVSNVRFSKGILYFVLKDENAGISAIMYSSLMDKLDFELEDGMTVLVQGKVGVYTRRGTYSINVTNIEQVGLGVAYLQFLQLKDKLAKEGLFNEKIKLSLPKYPNNIALITSGSGDAMHDVISTISKRYPLVNVLLYPAIVQGDSAPKSVINAINKVHLDGICDVIIICRGGGSIEDLSCFNDEELARVIYNSLIPTISGVGHEADFTICDFVASRRAPTPTGAAVVATPDKVDLLRYIDEKQVELVRNIKNKLIDGYNKYKQLSDSYILTNFRNVFTPYEERLSNLDKRLLMASPNKKIDDYGEKLKLEMIALNKGYIQFLKNKENSFKKNLDKLIILSPLNIMSKGYSVTFQKDKVITKIDDIDSNVLLTTKLVDGIVMSKVISVDGEKK